MIRDLWVQGKESIHDMRVMNTDVIFYQSKTPGKCLETAEGKKNKNCIHACLNERWCVTPFVASLDGLPEVEVEATLKCIASRLAKNWKELYSCTYGWVKSRVAITLVKTTHRCIRGTRVTESRISMTRPQWEDGAGLHLFR